MVGEQGGSEADALEVIMACANNEGFLGGLGSSSGGMRQHQESQVGTILEDVNRELGFRAAKGS